MSFYSILCKKQGKKIQNPYPGKYFKGSAQDLFMHRKKMKKRTAFVISRIVRRIREIVNDPKEIFVIKTAEKAEE